MHVNANNSSYYTTSNLPYGVPESWCAESIDRYMYVCMQITSAGTRSLAISPFKLFGAHFCSYSEGFGYRILATSRELRAIRGSMHLLGAESVWVGTLSVDADIGKYVSSELSRDHSCVDLMRRRRD